MPPKADSTERFRYDPYGSLKEIRIIGPFCGVFGNVFALGQVVSLTPNDMVIIIILPNPFSDLLCDQPFESANVVGNAFSVGFMNDHVNVIWHDYILIDAGDVQKKRLGDSTILSQQREDSAILCCADRGEQMCFVLCADRYEAVTV